MSRLKCMRRSSLADFILWAFVAGLFSLTGCINLEPQPDPISLYLLGGDVESATETIVTNERRLYIQRPNLPEYLRDLRLNFIADSGQVLTVPNARWSEPLEIGIARTLAQSVLAKNTAYDIAMYPWPKVEGSDQLMINVYHLDAKADGSFDVSIEWELEIFEKERRKGEYRSKQYKWDGLSAGSYVATMNTVLESLIDDVYSQSDL